MMKALFREEGASLRIELLEDPAVERFIDEHASILDSGFSKTEMSDAMRQRLQQSDWIFSGIKTFHELNEAFPSLLDENGEKKPFERFLNDVQKVDETYNGAWLRAEYNFAGASAEMAAKWERIQEDGDDYNLQYRTAGDDQVRPEHAALHGITLPPSDPFWDEFYPPNGWNCRCNTVQVLKDRYPTTDRAEAFARGQKALEKDTKGMFRFNSGKQERIFPDYNPYTLSKCNSCTRKLDLAKDLSDNELCSACLLIRSCYNNAGETRKVGEGQVTISNLVNRNDSDYAKLVQVAEEFAKAGKVVTLTPKMSRPPKFKYECIYGSLVGTKFEGKCPDLNIGGKWYEHEGFTSADPKRAFHNMMTHGLKQSVRLILDRPELTDRYMRKSILGRIERGADIQEVWLRDKKGAVALLYKKRTADISVSPRSRRIGSH